MIAKRLFYKIKHNTLARYSAIRESTYTQMLEGSAKERDLRHAAAVAVCDGVLWVGATAHAHALGKDLLQLRRGAASDQRANQRQRVVVEVRL